MNLAKAQLQNYKFTHKKLYSQCSGTKVGWGTARETVQSQGKF